MNTNTLEVAAARTFDDVRESAVRNTGSSSAQRITFYLIWAAVSLPLIWGVLKAWDEAQLMF
jgi:hypothetical protein